MRFAIRWKKQLLAAAVVVTSGVLVWGTFVFTAIWLRVRCARELAKLQRPLDELTANQYSILRNSPTGMILWDVSTSNPSRSREDELLTHLEELQRPSVKTVLRSLFSRWTSKENNHQLELAEVIAFDPGPFVATAPIGEEESDALTATLSIELTASQSPASVSSGQLLGQILWETTRANRVYLVSDSDGERLIVIARTHPAVDSENQDSSPIQEILIIDTSGQILDRSLLRDGDLIGRLAETHGRADQVVFGAIGLGSNKAGTYHLASNGTGTVRIIDHGKWKTIRSIESLSSSNRVKPSEESPSETTP